MINGMETFRDIIDQWPTLVALADDLGVSNEVTKKWRQRDSIPAEYWADLITAAKARKIKLKADDLVTIASKAA